MPRPGRLTAKRSASVLGLLLLITLIGVSADFALKGECASSDWRNGIQYTRLCYSDPVALYRDHHLDLDRIPYVEEENEYPVATGALMYGAALLSSSSSAFFVWNLVILGACALLTTLVLWATVRDQWQVLLFAAAPAIALYTAHNWDMAAVLCVAVGLWQWRKQRWTLAGVAFGVGVAAKLYPLAALPTGIAALLVAGRRREAGRYAAALVGAWAALNVPVMIASFSGWLRSYTFHAERVPDFGSSWYWPFDRRVDFSDTWFRLTVDLVGLGSMAGALVVVVWLQRRRQLPMENATAILIATFLLVAKVHSPQYALWLLPFYVIVRRSPMLLASWAMYVVADVLVFVSVFRRIAQFSRFSDDTINWELLLQMGVGLRVVAIVLGVAAFLAPVRARAGPDAMPASTATRPAGVTG